MPYALKHDLKCYKANFHYNSIDEIRDFPGGPVVKTVSFHCRGHRLDPLSGN